MKCFALLALAGLSGCSIARHGAVSVPDARVNWPQPPLVSGQTSAPTTLFRVDHGYSAFNYKHANKARQARYRMGNEGIPVHYPQPGLTRVATYKMPVPGRMPVGGVVVEHRLATGLAARNDKMPQSGRLLPTPQPDQPGQRTGPLLETLNRRTAPIQIDSSTNNLD